MFLLLLMYYTNQCMHPAEGGVFERLCASNNQDKRKGREKQMQGLKKSEKAAVRIAGTQLHVLRVGG